MGSSSFADGLTRTDLLNLSVVSAIEALPSPRLHEAWFERAALDGRVGLRLGPLGADFRVTEPPFFIAEAAYTHGDKDGRLLPDAAVIGLRAPIACRRRGPPQRAIAAVRSRDVFAPPRSSHRFGSSCDCRLTKR